MNPSEACDLFATARVARLATAGRDGSPHLVPVTFALLGQARVVSAIDHKPKRTAALRRLRNIAVNPSVALLADHYEEDWTALWWVRADGRARVLHAGGEEAELRAAALAALVARYEQYARTPPAGAVIVVEVDRWSGWRGGRVSRPRH